MKDEAVQTVDDRVGWKPRGDGQDVVGSPGVRGRMAVGSPGMRGRTFAESLGVRGRPLVGDRARSGINRAGVLGSEHTCTHG